MIVHADNRYLLRNENVRELACDDDLLRNLVRIGKYAARLRQRVQPCRRFGKRKRQALVEPKPKSERVVAGSLDKRTESVFDIA